jgi:N-acetylmuramoyl-L-alanine amidase CwlA
MTPQYITIHNTWNDASALAEVSYMSGNQNATSFHVAIDDKHAVEAIPFSRNAWHAGDGQGDGNRKSIGIEICYSKSGGAKYAEAEANAIEYTAHLLKQYGWGIDRVKWHRDWSGKNCPHRILDEGRASAVRGAIARKLAELNSPVKPAAEVKPVIKPEVKPVADEKNAQPSRSLAAEFKRAIERGITDGTYPNRIATRAEVAVMVLRALEEAEKLAK